MESVCSTNNDRLLAKDRVEEATKSLRRIRKDKTEEDIDFEIQAIQHAHSNDHKGKCSELFDSKNRLRTMVAILAMFGQQITGQAFASQYSVIFYLSQGFGARSFLFTVINSVAGLACLLITWFTVDLVGRRVLLLIGGTGMAVFLFIVGSVGTIKNPTEIQKNTLVSSSLLQMIYLTNFCRLRRSFSFLPPMRYHGRQYRTSSFLKPHQVISKRRRIFSPQSFLS